MSTYKPMSTREYHDARRALDQSHEGFAELIGVSWRQHMRYDGGHVKTIPRPVAKLIRTVLRHNIKPEEVG